MGAAVGGVVGAAAGTAVAVAAGGSAATAGLSALGKAAVSAGSAGAIGAGTNAAIQATKKGITNVDGKEAAAAGVKSAVVSMVFSGISAIASSGSSSSISGAGSQGRATLHSSGKQHGDAVHYSQITEKVKSMNNSNMYSDIYVNKGIRNIIPNAAKNYRPDIMGVRNDGLVDIFEVQSPSQTIQFMQDKVNKLSDMLGDKAGVVDFIRRIVK